MEATRIERDALKSNLENTEKDSSYLIEENDNLKKELEKSLRTIETLKRENNELLEKLGILIDRIDSVRKINTEAKKNNRSSVIHNTNHKNYEKEETEYIKEDIKDIPTPDNDKLTNKKENTNITDYEDDPFSDKESVKEAEEYKTEKIQEVKIYANVKASEDEDPFSNASDSSWDNDIKNDNTEDMPDNIDNDVKEEIKEKEDNYEFDISEDDRYMFGDEEEEEFFFDNESK